MTAPFPLYLMRHGEPELSGRLLGATDCAATPDGIAACVRQSDALTPTRIVSSDLRRASACANAIAAGRAVTIDPRWRELDFGAWNGLAASEVDQDALGRFWTDPDASPPPDGERLSALVDRVASAIDDLVAEPTLVVAHGGSIRAALSVLCGLPYDRLWSFDLPCSVVVGLTVWPGPTRSAQIFGIWP